MDEWLSFRYDGSEPEEIVKQGDCYLWHWYLSRSNDEYEGKFGMDIPRPANARYVMLLWDTTGWSDRNSVVAAVPLDLGVFAPVGDEHSNMYAVFVNDPQAFYSRQTLSDVEGKFDIFAIHLEQEQWAGQFSAEGAPLWGAGMEHDAPVAADDAGEGGAADDAGEGGPADDADEGGPADDADEGGAAGEVGAEVGADANGGGSMFM